ncbi:MAG: VWA domain-containing protein [Verrucomicrobia bacterium]|nr:VWA domain-containing protein [Verrucomicrobiota bacterium]
MTFAHPYFLLLLLLLPVLAWLKGKHGQQPAFLYSSVQLVRDVSRVRRTSTGRVLLALRWLALALFIVGLARPQHAESETTVKASGIDIVIALDLSTSMESEDFTLDRQRVNRLDIAKHVLRQFIEKRPGDRIGIVAFARQAFIASPITLDHTFLLQNLDRLKLRIIEDGTAIGSGLMAALNRLRDVQAKSKLVILMTDGQNNVGAVPPATAAEAAEALNVKVYTIGVGTRGTAPVPRLNVFGQKVYVQVPVDIDEDTLQKIARRTGGKYYRADSTDTLRKIYDDIDQLEKTEVEMKQYVRVDELFAWAVVPGLFLLLLEILLSHTLWRRLP